MVDNNGNAHGRGIVRTKNKQSAANGLSRRALLRFVAGSAVSTISSSAFAQQPSEQWDELVTAALKEKTVTIATLTGNATAKAFEAFQKTFPGITVTRQAFSSNSLIIPKVIEEQGAGLYLRDLAITATPNTLAQLKPRGALESIRELIIRPDVTGDQYWVSGFEDGFSDIEKRFAYNAFANAYWPFWINTDLVPDGAIKSVSDLLRPEWKGKLVMPDVQNGATYGAMATIRTNIGDAAVKGLMADQRPTIMRDMNQLVEAMVRGRFPIAIGVYPQILSQFTEQGLGRNLKRIDLPEARHMISNGGIMRFKNGPSPNAAKLFVNWFLTRDAQRLWSAALEENSRRTDVPPFNAEFTPVPGGNYIDYSKEINGKIAASTIRMLRELMGN